MLIAPLCCSGGCPVSSRSSLCLSMLEISSMGRWRPVTHTCWLSWLLGRPFPSAGTKLSSNAAFMQIVTYFLKLKINTWKKYSLLILRGLIDSINFLWQIRPERSNKKRTSGFSSGVYSPPHESEQSRKLYQVYREQIHQHICFSSLWQRRHKHAHTHSHPPVSSTHS